MKAEKNNNSCFYVIGSLALTIVGFIVIPPLIKKCSNKVYKASLKKEKIDFDNMGPEIVKKESEEDQ